MNYGSFDCLQDMVTSVNRERRRFLQCNPRFLLQAGPQDVRGSQLAVARRTTVTLFPSGQWQERKAAAMIASENGHEQMVDSLMAGGFVRQLSLILGGILYNVVQQE